MENRVERRVINIVLVGTALTGFSLGWFLARGIEGEAIWPAVVANTLGFVCGLVAVTVLHSVTLDRAAKIAQVVIAAGTLLSPVVAYAVYLSSR